MAASVGLMEWLLVLLMGGSSLFTLPLGLPPAGRDAALLRAPADHCIVYLEWAERSSGAEGAAGIDGFVADPEVVAFAEQVETAIVTGITPPGGPDNDKLAVREIPPLVKTAFTRPGCLFVSLDATDLPAVDEAPNFAPLLERLQVGIIFGLGDTADETQASILRLCRANGLQLPDKWDHTLLPIPAPGGGIQVHRHDDYLIAGYGPDTIDAVVAGLAGDREGIAGDERISAALEEVAVGRSGQVLWLDLASISAVANVTAGSQAAVEQTLEVLGLGGVEHLVCVKGVNEAGRVVTHNHLHTDGELEGVLALYSGRALTTADFKHIPADADVVVAGSLNPENILGAIRGILAEAAPAASEEFDQELSAIETELGLSLEKDLFTALGAAWTLYDSPGNGGTLVSAPVLAVEVQDAEGAYRVVSQLMQAFKNALPGDQPGGYRKRGVYLGQQKFLDRTIYYVNTVGDDVPVAPALCVTDTHLLIALHPQPLKGHLRFLAGEEPSLADSLAENSPVADHSLVFYSRIDTEAAARYVYLAAPYIGQVMFGSMQSDGVALDIFALPSARAMLPYCSASEAWVAVTDHGITASGIEGIPLLSLIGGGTQLLPFFMIAPAYSHLEYEAPPAIEAEPLQAPQFRQRLD